VATPGELIVEFVQHDVREQRRERRALRHPLIDTDHDTVRQHHLGLEQPADQHEQPPIVDSLREPRGQPLVIDPIEELLQIDVDHPLEPIAYMHLGLGDRRVAASTGPEPVATRVECRLEQRFENLPHGLHHHPVDHVRDPQSALPAVRLGDHRPANPARTIAPGQ
jgi:hypothetical protein